MQVACLSLLWQGSPELNVKLSFASLNAAQLPSDIRVVSAAILYVSDGFRLVNPTDGLLLVWFVLDDSVVRKHNPFGVGDIILGELECGLLETA